ncbi:S9 family peptidase [Bradyrhizobium sp. 190]|uniref:alpha/beta hydrolase family protein n=1 Tax=Bradyrhizobium sp. 190 TaxID=2782658 RepID=UPI001FFB13A4|nr:alpha/beta hydrolase [Bradyrhizobium sp. 190]
MTNVSAFDCALTGKCVAMYKCQCGTSTARYEPAGWTHWPGHEDYSFQFMRLLGSAQEGASTISECFSTAARINVGDGESWYREWRRIGEVNKKRGDEALRQGFIETARSNWLRASNYYRSAQYFLRPQDERYLAIFDQIEMCSRLYLKHLTPPGEIVQIPFEGDQFLPGYLLRAPNAPAKAPAVLCFGGPDACKDEQLYKIPRHAFARSLSLLVVDLPGQGAAVRQNKLTGRHDQEVAISRCVDYLLTRDDVDHKRLVLYGDGIGGSYASRAASSDDRFVAAVCDGGLWDQNERIFLSNWLFGADDDDQPGNSAKIMDCGFAGNINCPYLVTVGEHDFIDAKTATDLYKRRRTGGANIDLRVFSAEDTGASHGQADNPTLGKEFIFDWIVSKIGIVRP